MCRSKKGMSALQIQHTLGLGSYRSAWYMCHRVRAAMENTDFAKLMGIVEVDETYVGGKNWNRHAKDRKAKAYKAREVTVVGAIARKGNVVAKVISKPAPAGSTASSTKPWPTTFPWSLRTNTPATSASDGPMLP